jgi:hypothetical protein
MPHINYDNKEVTFKLVYYGPGMSGKTTNLVQIHHLLAPDLKGDLVSLDTDEERTLFFDFFPLEIGDIMGYALRFNLYTVPGQIYYEATRKLLLDGADGVVFVADSQSHRVEENLVSFDMLHSNMREYRMDIDRFPLVLQYNKRDCEDPIEVGSLERKIGLSHLPVHEAVAFQGEGVMETIRTLSKQVVRRFQF